MRLYAGTIVKSESAEAGYTDGGVGGTNGLTVGDEHGDGEALIIAKLVAGETLVADSA